jgi:predicted O-linked N-acetylglucosamine transferase (SPINDLY family)
MAKISRQQVTSKAYQDKAAALFNAGNMQDAELLFRGMLARNKNDAYAIYHIALIHYTQGKFADGLRLIERGKASAPKFAPLWYAHAMLLQASGQKEQALHSYDRAISLHPNYADALLNSGVLLRELFQHHKALARFEQLLEFDPNNQVALENCAALQSQIDQPEQSKVDLIPASILVDEKSPGHPPLSPPQAFVAVEHADPRMADLKSDAETTDLVFDVLSCDDELLADVKAAIALVKQRRYDTAVVARLAEVRTRCAQKLLGAEPASFQSCLSGALGQALKKLVETGAAQWAPTPADEVFLPGITDVLRDPTSQIQMLQALAAVMLYTGPHLLDTRRAISAVDGDLQKIYRKYLFLAPSMFRQLGEVDAYEKYWRSIVKEVIEGLRSAGDLPFWQQVATDFVNISQTVPLYFSNSNLRWNMVTRASLIEGLVAVNLASPGLDFQFPVRAKGKIRLGILAAHFRPQTETYATLPVYRNLNRYLFDVVLISQSAFEDHPLEAYCRSFADKAISLTGKMGADVRTIRELDLDALWIGTNLTAGLSYTVQLAVHRLARLQLTGGCSPVTTGFRHMDVFVSGSATEPEHAQQHYTERLHLLEGPAHCFDMATALEPVHSSALIDRSALAVADDVTLFVSGANLYKIIPELLDAWIDILKGSPNSCLLLFPFNPNWHDNYPVATFKLHVARSANDRGVSADRFIIVPPLEDRSRVLELLKMADIYLDSFPYSGMTSLLDPLEVGLPIVAIEGNCQRQRMSASALRSLGLTDWLVDDPAAYVARAINLAGDPSARKAMRNALATAMSEKPKFLNVEWFSAAVGEVIRKELNRSVGIRG